MNILKFNFDGLMRTVWPTDYVFIHPVHSGDICNYVVITTPAYVILVN